MLIDLTSPARRILAGEPNALEQLAVIGHAHDLSVEMGPALNGLAVPPDVRALLGRDDNTKIKLVPKPGIGQPEIKSHRPPFRVPAIPGAPDSINPVPSERAVHADGAELFLPLCDTNARVAL